jgi:hypothetical protein
MLVVFMVGVFSNVMAEEEVPKMGGEVVVQFNGGFTTNNIKEIISKYGLKVKEVVIGQYDCFLTIYDMQGNINDYIKTLNSSGLFSEITDHNVSRTYNGKACISQGLRLTPKLETSKEEIENFCKKLNNTKIECKLNSEEIMVIVTAPIGKEEEISDELGKIPNVVASPNYLLSSE